MDESKCWPAPLKRWNRDNHDAGHYSLLAGFEHEMDEATEGEWCKVDLYTRLDVYGRVLDLLDEAKLEGGEG